ncbi:MAG TPA: M56 family metallopeptidase, partial [Opitutales bacterium]|nr:M56 family metallopeptidase [Opitutales bacterium]
MNAPLTDGSAFSNAAVLLALVDAVVKSAALLALALAASVCLRKKSAAARHAWWCGALAGTLLLPALSLALPAWRVPWLPAVNWPSTEQQSIPTFPQKISVGQTNGLEINNVVAVPPAETTPLEVSNLKSASNSKPETQNQSNKALALNVQSSAFKGGSSSPRSLLPAFFICWFVGALLAVLPLLAGCGQAARLTKRGTPLASPEWNALLAEVTRELGLRRKVRLLAVPGAVMPFTWGAWRPVVIFPEAAEGWTPARRRLVLLHELGHIKRLDWLTQTLGTLACALYWFNPLAWLAARRMRLEREQACDDLVLRCGPAPREYAHELVAIAASSARGNFLNWASVPVARHAKLETRLRAILDGTRNRQKLTRAALLLLAAAVAVMVIPLAMLKAAVPTQAAPANPTGQIAQPASATPPTDKNAYAVVTGEIHTQPALHIKLDPKDSTTVSAAI